MACISRELLARQEPPPNAFGFFCQGVDIDPLIWPLVRVLNLKGIRTRSSCQEHYIIDGGKYIFPWVRLDVPPFKQEDKKRIEKLREVLADYNFKNDIKWNLVNSYGLGYDLLRSITHAPIFVLQETILPVSRYIDLGLENCVDSSQP